MGESAINEPKTAKMSRATAATILRLPRSAHRASGTAHSSWDTWATKATAPERGIGHVERDLQVVADEAMPLPKVPGIMAAPVIRTSGA